MFRSLITFGEVGFRDIKTQRISKKQAVIHDIIMLSVLLTSTLFDIKSKEYLMASSPDVPLFLNHNFSPERASSEEISQYVDELCFLAYVLNQFTMIEYEDGAEVIDPNDAERANSCEEQIIMHVRNIKGYDATHYEE